MMMVVAVFETDSFGLPPGGSLNCCVHGTPPRVGKGEQCLGEQCLDEINVQICISPSIYFIIKMPGLKPPRIVAGCLAAE